jgi:hypothetical protein
LPHPQSAAAIRQVLTIQLREDDIFCTGHKQLDVKKLGWHAAAELLAIEGARLAKDQIDLPSPWGYQLR